MLSQGKPRDAAVNFDTIYRILQQHRAVSLILQRLSCIHLFSDHSNAEITHADFQAENHGTRQKSR